MVTEISDNNRLNDQSMVTEISDNNRLNDQQIEELLKSTPVDKSKVMTKEELDSFVRDEKFKDQYTPGAHKDEFTKLLEDPSFTTEQALYFALNFPQASGLAALLPLDVRQVIVDERLGINTDLNRSATDIRASVRTGANNPDSSQLAASIPDNAKFDYMSIPNELSGKLPPQSPGGNVPAPDRGKTV